jgi:glycosyltransferase involved in cell wall biosynthesis
MPSIAVIPAWYPGPGRPLEGVFVRDHARAAALHNEVAVLVNEPDPPPGRKLFSVDDAVEDGLRTFRIRHRAQPQAGTAGYLLGIQRALARLRREGRPVELLHAHVHGAAWTAMLVASTRRIPFVVSEHSSEFASTGIAPGALRRARVALPRAALVCPVSEYLRRQIEAHGIQASFRVVPNPVDTELFALAARSEGGPTRMIAVASLQPAKGIALLLEAAAGLEGDWALDVVGDGPQRADCEALARQPALGGRVTFHGLQPRREVAALIRRADFLVQPSLGETFSVVVAEAMACGLPVVATRVGGLPELVDETSGLLVEPGSAPALRAAVQRMLDGHGDYPREEIAARAGGRWSLQAIGAAWTDVYRSVLGRG